MEVNNHKRLIVPRKCKAQRTTVVRTPYETHNEVGAINTRNLGDFDPKIQWPRTWNHWQVLETVTCVGFRVKPPPTSCPPRSSTVPVIDSQCQL
jgi:hypothetical protein